MVDFVKVFKTIEGDVYHITLSQETSILSFKTLDAIKDTTLVGIDLRRLEGRHATGQAVLAAIEKTIADYYLQKKDVVICYYCDFINPIPRTTKNTMPPQEYRSRLFKRMVSVSAFTYCHKKTEQGILAQLCYSFVEGCQRSGNRFL